MPTYLEGLAIQSYRGIGPKMQYIAPFSDMNFFVGANNAGKSVVLKFIAEHLESGSSGTLTEKADIYIGSKEGEFGSLIGISEQTFAKHLAEILQQRVALFSRNRQVVSPIVANDIDSLVAEIANRLPHLGGIWIAPFNPNQKPTLSFEIYKEDHDFGLDAHLWTQMTKVFGLVNPRHANSAAQGVLRHVTGTLGFEFPERLLIPAKRQLSEGEETFDDLSGKGLIQHLAEIQNPDFDERDRKIIFDKINSFVQVVTGKPDALLEVPNHRNHLLVHIDDKVLPLSSLGTGIHEVILIAAFCTIHQQKIMCLEEPEIHLHPVLQRKLIQYLKEHTENQYFIATHSAAFIDTQGASVFHVRNDGVQTYVEAAITKGEQRKICDELGYRASDILQSNAVIWVEGPSDRIYIRHWLKETKALDEELIEGVHYTIMFYGGGLISHLSADESAIDDFINLRNLNRNIAVVIDSDKVSPRAELKPATQRIKDEMTKGGGVVWITKGREIENYVPNDRLQNALRALHPNIYLSPLAGGAFDHAFYFERKGTKAGSDNVFKSADKVGAATIVCADSDPVDFSVLDLNERITELAQMVARANGMKS